MSRNGWSRRFFAAAIVACVCAALSTPEPCAAEEIPARPAAATTIGEIPAKSLLSGRFPGAQWVYFAGKKDARVEQTWSIDRSTVDPILICRGEPHGYLRTTAVYSNFQMGLEWKYPTDENGNSGVLLFTTGEDKLWPTAVQVQLHKPRTGSILASGRAKVDLPLRTKNHFSRPVNQWNELILTCYEGVVMLRINGKEVGEVQVANPQAGSIGLQSEGSEVHFRKMWIRELRTPSQAKVRRNRPLCPAPLPVNYLFEEAPIAKNSGAISVRSTYSLLDRTSLGNARSGKSRMVVRWTVAVNGTKGRRAKDWNHVAYRIPVAADSCVCLPDRSAGAASDATGVPSRRDDRRSDRIARRSDATD